MKWIKWITVIILTNFLLSQAFGREEFYIASMLKEQKRATGDIYLFLKTVYKSNPREVSDVEVKFYALLKKGSKETLAEGSRTFSGVKKGRHEVIMVIKPSYFKSYGRVNKMRVEIWSDEELMASKTKPSLGKKKKAWWEEGERKSIIEPGQDIIKLIKEIERLD